MNKFNNNIEMAPPKATPKSQVTRERILSASLALFARDGYSATTMRDIAKEAGVSLGLTYRYFSRKEELVLALYEELSGNASRQMADIKNGPLAERYPLAVSRCLASLEPHRKTLGSLFSAGLSIDSSVAVLGDNSATIRQLMWKSYHRLVVESSDAPKGRLAEHFATLLYAGHLMSILFWLQDRSEDQATTQRLIAFIGKSLKLARPFWNMKPVTRLIEELVDIMAPFFGPSDLSRG